MTRSRKRFVTGIGAVVTLSLALVIGCIDNSFVRLDGSSASTSIPDEEINQWNCNQLAAASQSLATRIAEAQHLTGSQENDKVVVCHVPPGNSAAAHAISVGTPAVRAHLDHGDSLGPCADDDSSAEDDGDEPEEDADSNSGDEGDDEIVDACASDPASGI